MWIASLSNGETVAETQPVPSALSPWQHLLMRCQAEHLRIVQVRLQQAGRTFHAIPHADGYMCAYEQRSALNGHKQQTFQLMGSVDFKTGLVFITKINEQGDSWQEVKPLGNVYVHTTAREQRDLIG